MHNPAVIANGSSGVPEKNGNDVRLISTFPNPVNVMSTIGDISPKLDHVIVTIGEISLKSVHVISNGSSGVPEKNGNDVFQVSTFPNPVNVMSTIGDISPKLDHVIVTLGEISPKSDHVISNGSSGVPEKNGNDVRLISATPNPVNVMSTIGDISPKLDHVIVTLGEI